jgi:hypothetical protein
MVAPSLVSPGYQVHFASVAAAGALGALIAGALWRAMAK